MDARNLDHQLAPVAGVGQGDVADVVFDVDVALADPVRPVEAEGRRHQTVAEDLEPAQAVFEEFQHLLEAPEHSLARR